MLAMCYRVVGPSVRPLTIISRDAISADVVEGYERNLEQVIIVYKWLLLKWFSRSEVKGQGHRENKCTFAAETLHFDGVASRFTYSYSPLIVGNSRSPFPFTQRGICRLSNDLCKQI